MFALPVNDVLLPIRLPAITLPHLKAAVLL